MLEQVLRHLNNYFVLPGGIYHGSISVEQGSLSLSFLKKGQYFRIVGSVFNDGLYQYPAYGLVDEQFEGAIWALAVPKAVVDLAEEIAQWEKENGNASQYVSESFDGYSYTKATNAKGQPVTWKDVFRSELNQWRKIGCSTSNT